MLIWRDILIVCCNKNIVLRLIISFILKLFYDKLEIYKKYISVNGKNDLLYVIYFLRLFLFFDRVFFLLIVSFYLIIWVNLYFLEIICIFI